MLGLGFRVYGFGLEVPRYPVSYLGLVALVLVAQT